MDAAVVFDPGFYYFSGYYLSSDPVPGGGLCVNGAYQVLGQDVELEFGSTV